MKTPNAANLLDHLIFDGDLKNDAALARLLDVAPPVISKIRSGKLPLGPSMLLRMHDETGISIKNLCERAGIPPFLGRP